MTIEKFLSFWSQYNTAIIEGLIALVIILSLYLAFRSFFVKKDKDAEAGGSQGLDAAQLERTLQKILENQSVTKPNRGSAPASEDFGMDVDLEQMEREPVGGGVVMESAAEVQQLRVTAAESQQKIETLQKQLKEALQSAEAAAAAAASESGAGAASGLSEQERNELSGKIRDLEARLAEYEIISEDIADLSRYRDENEQLKKQLEMTKVGGGAVAAAPAEPSTPAPTSEPAPVVTAAPIVEEPAAPIVAEAPAPAATETGSSDLIDDELMKEFAAAVEGQKNLEKVAEKAGDGSEAGKSNEDADKLMNEFESFVSKKS